VEMAHLMGSETFWATFRWIASSFRYLNRSASFARFIKADRSFEVILPEKPHSGILLVRFILRNFAQIV